MDEERLHLIDCRTAAFRPAPLCQRGGDFKSESLLCKRAVVRPETVLCDVRQILNTLVMKMVQFYDVEILIRSDP